MSLFQRLDRIAKRMDDLEGQVRAVGNQPQAQRTSVEGGSIDFNDADGNLKAIVGEQADGSTTVHHVDGPTPPAPQGFSAVADGPVISVDWSGNYAEQPTFDLDFVEVSAQCEGAVLKGTLVQGGAHACLLSATRSGVWSVALTAVSKAGRRSEASETATVTVDLVDLAGAIEAVQVSANGKNQVHYSPRRPTTDDPGAPGDTWFVNEVDPDTQVMLIVEQWQHLGGVWVQTALNHEVIATLDLGKATVGELDGIRIKSKTIGTEQLSANFADFMVSRNGTVIAGNDRVVLNDEGFTVFDENQDWRVRLTPYGSTFKGDLEAESLVSTGPAEFRHTENRIAQGARLVLDAGVTDPTAPPVVQPYWPSRSFTPPAGGVLYGLAYADSKYWTFVDIPDAAEGDRVISINPSTGAVGDEIPITDQFWASGGVTAIGSELFLLGQKSGTSYKYFVRVYSTAGAFLREWEYTDAGWSKSNPLTYKPGIGTDGTNVVIAQCDDNGSLLWRTYNPSTGALLATVDCKDQTKSDIGGIDIGPADWGGGTWVTVRKTSGEIGDAIVVFSTTGAYDPAKSWKTAENGRDTGLVFADGKFRTLNGGGRINEYTSPSTGDGESDWWAAYRWEAVENGVLVSRSRISPPARFTWPRRARLKVIGSPLPVGVSSIGGAVAKKTSTPVRTDFRQTNTHYRPGEPVALWAYLNADWKTAGIPGDSNTFPTATPSSIASASSTFEVRGDGTGRWGPLTINPNGTVTNSSDVGWTDLPNPQQPFTERSNGQYMIRGGIVYFRGQYSFTGSGMQTVMTLPPAIRPGYLYQTGANSNTTVNLNWEITAGGDLKLWTSGATGAWAPLTPISYPIG